MAGITLRGLNWGHRRARGPLQAACDAYCAARPDIRIDWGQRSLGGFAAEAMGEVVGHHDLIVFDHPFAGAIMEQGHFLPLDTEFPEQLSAGREALWAGPSLQSYRFGGRVWGAPVDAACMHGLARRDLLDQLGWAVPASWDETLTLARRAAAAGRQVAIGCAPPHGFLVFASLYANTGPALPDDPRRGDLDLPRAVAILAAMAELAALGPAEALDWNSIAVHEAMTTTDEILFCPCEFGYATYGEGIGAARLSFSAFAGMAAPFHRGAVLGGAAIGVPAGTPHRPEVLDLLRHLLAADTQERIFGAHHGQAAAAGAWRPGAADARFNGFFSAVRPTLEAASIRPRFPGFIPFQMEAGRIVRGACAGLFAAAEAGGRLAALHRAERDRLDAQAAPLA